MLSNQKKLNVEYLLLNDWTTKILFFFTNIVVFKYSSFDFYKKDILVSIVLKAIVFASKLFYFRNVRVRITNQTTRFEYLETRQRKAVPESNCLMVEREGINKSNSSAQTLYEMWIAFGKSIWLREPIDLILYAFVLNLEALSKQIFHLPFIT